MARLNRGQLRALTGLRFFAAFHAVVFHYGRAGLTGAPPLVRGLADMGYISVGLFFMLSGFVLTYSYSDEHGQLSVDRRKFWIARVARIYPVYAFALLLAAPNYVHDLSQQVGTAWAIKRAALTFIPVFTLTQAWTPFTYGAWNGPAWSLSVEAFFYLVFPFIVGRIACDSRGKLMRVGGALWLLGMALPLVFVALSYRVDLNAVTYAIGGRTISLGELVERTIGFMPLLRLPEFVLGMYMGKYFLARPAPGASEARTQAIRSAVAVVGIFVALVVLARYPRWRYVAQNGLLAPLFALLIDSLARDRVGLGRLLGTATLFYLGEVSYGVYILQEPVHGWFARLIAETPRVLPFLAYSVVLVVVSALAFRFIEMPFQKRIRQAFDARRKRVAERHAAA